ncbi:hypothetical protein FY034_06400 [Trichlorobacter lovleyi]|uniref:hypothetical protein n=1 Tax=Trichlorobacter lovleyi TaxID=313985 RepID=UPI002240A9C7|nr:hypothetical protein [Trichlorobacter lovleyi]QOX78571.1 hypothetical protein FY034_06400 [Trichlorobacter lovleyi]
MTWQLHKNSYPLPGRRFNHQSASGKGGPEKLELALITDISGITGRLQQVDPDGYNLQPFRQALLLA